MEYDPIPEGKATVATPQPPTAPHNKRDKAEATPPRRRRRRLFFLIQIPLFIVLLAAVAGVGLAAWIHMPQVETLEGFVPRLITQLHDRNGQVYRTYSRENRVLLEEGEVPTLLQNAVIAAEDSNFFQHGGVDPQGVLRAFITNLRRGRRAQGASTLTMQLARELFLTREKELKRKIEEAFLAVQLEKEFSKQQIITLYCNLVNLGHGNYGMEAAARSFFNKSVADLTLAESATLAGIPQRPADYSVYRAPERVTKRRNYVLRRMLEEEMITQAEHDAAAAETLLVTSRRRESHLGPYFAEEVRRTLYDTYGTTTFYDHGLQIHTTLDRQIQRAAETALRDGLLSLDHRKGWRGPLLQLEGEDFADRTLPSWSEQNIEPIPGAWFEGIVLQVDTKEATVKIGDRTFPLTAAGFRWTRKSRPKDLLKAGDVAWFSFEVVEDKKKKKQDEVEVDVEPPPLRLVLEQEPELEGAVLVLESNTGAVRAMVGGWDYERNEFNRATQAQRQVGSAMKPFVYGAALENGYTAADTLFDGPITLRGASSEESYSPRNYYRRYNGIITLRRALELSINVTAVKLLDLVGIETVIGFARRCGIQSALPPYPSLALGAADLTPLEMAAAYAAIANQGIYLEPYFIERVTTPDGQVMQEHIPQAHKAMTPQIAYVLTRMLKGVVDSGTGTGLRGIDLEMAGKTGTTNDYTDAWFVGYTPRYTLISWVGYDKKRSLGRGMTGAEAALPIWRTVVKRGLEDGWLTAGETFAQPSGIIEVEVEHGTGLRFGPGASRLVREVFVEGTEPEQTYNYDWARIMQLPWYQQEPFYLPKEGERMPSQIEDWSVVRASWSGKSRG